jgi:hypothetical protein
MTKPIKTPPATAAIFLTMHSSWNVAKLFDHEAGQVPDHLLIGR